MVVYSVGKMVPWMVEESVEWTDSQMVALLVVKKVAPMVAWRAEY